MARFKMVAGWKLIKFLVIFFALTGCVSGGYKAPVSDRPPPPSEKINHHIVAEGETLYSIAWRYGLDFRGLARANRIDNHFQIYPGQRLTLANSSSDPLPAPSRKNQNPVSSKDSNRKKAEPVIQPKKPGKYVKPTKLVWHWPVTGKLIQRFSSTKGLKKGIDILAKKGESVFSTAAGDVVYAGEGLRGYGKLVIIKHNQIFLSAYAHNNKILVNEGDKVKAGQKIAEVGSTGTVRNMLHFEIRKNGIPVDPEAYLPRR